MEAWLIFLLVFMGLLILAGIIVVVVLVFRSKDTPKLTSCTTTFDLADIVGKWTSNNTTDVVNMYASTDELKFTEMGQPFSTNAPIISSSPSDTPVTTGTARVTGVPVGVIYNTYFVISDPTDRTKFSVCSTTTDASINGNTFRISTESIVGGISRNLNTNTVTYILGASPAANTKNIWLYTGETPSGTIPPYTLSNTNADGTRYFLYNDNNSLAAGQLNGVSAANYQFIYNDKFEWVLKSTANTGIGINGPVVNNAPLIFSDPATTQWENVHGT